MDFAHHSRYLFYLCFAKSPKPKVIVKVTTIEILSVIWIFRFNAKSHQKAQYQWPMNLHSNCAHLILFSAFFLDTFIFLHCLHFPARESTARTLWIFLLTIKFLQHPPLAFKERKKIRSNKNLIFLVLPFHLCPIVFCSSLGISV